GEDSTLSRSGQRRRRRRLVGEGRAEGGACGRSGRRQKISPVFPLSTDAENIAVLIQCFVRRAIHRQLPLPITQSPIGGSHQPCGSPSTSRDQAAQLTSRIATSRRQPASLNLAARLLRHGSTGDARRSGGGILVSNRRRALVFPSLAIYCRACHSSCGLCDPAILIQSSGDRILRLTKSDADACSVFV
ncbi:unnamed protein product, partial [Urochloa humidicola]